MPWQKSGFFDCVEQQSRFVVGPHLAFFASDTLSAAGSCCFLGAPDARSVCIGTRDVAGLAAERQRSSAAHVSVHGPFGHSVQSEHGDFWRIPALCRIFHAGLLFVCGGTAGVCSWSQL